MLADPAPSPVWGSALQGPGRPQQPGLPDVLSQVALVWGPRGQLDTRGTGFPPLGSVLPGRGLATPRLPALRMALPG